MKREAGLWVDHRKAVMVIFTDDEEETKTIESNMKKHIRFSSGSSESGQGEDVRDRQFQNNLNRFYDEVIEAIGDAQSIQIFGPGEAKGELEKRYKEKGFSGHIFAVETVDKLTDRQIAAKVRERFQT